MGLRFLAFAIVLGLSAASYGQLDNVFGTDRRQPVTSTAYPWRAIGWVSTGCTGTLVGRNWVLTAAHCVVDESTGKLSANLDYFYPNRIGGNSTEKAYIEHVWWGTSSPNTYRAADWAIMRLSTNLGDRYGWMGVTDDPAVTYVTAAGYSEDYNYGRTATADVGCWIQEKVGGLLYHSCHTARGSSGGPIFSMRGTEAYIYALNVAEFRKGGDRSLQLPSYSVEYANIGIPSSVFLSKLKELKGE